MHREIKFSGGVIHRLLLRELHHNGPTDEMQFMLGNQSVRFSKVEFYLIAGLRFGVVPDTTKYAAVENGIHQRYFPGVDEVSLKEIRGVVTVAEFGKAYDTVKLYLIYMLNWILMGVDERFKIPVWKFRLVDDLDAFSWGAHVYRHSIFSFKHTLDGRRDGFELRQQEKGPNVHTVETYNIYGLSHALLVFAFEVIPDLAKEFGAWRVTDLTSCILKWELAKQPRGKKLAKIFKARELVPTPAERQAPYYAGLNEGGGSMYIEDDRDDMPPPVFDQTTFGWNSGTKGGGLTDMTSDSEGSEPAGGGLRPSDSEGYETDYQRERHRHIRVLFTTPGHFTSTGDSSEGVGRDGEIHVRQRTRPESVEHIFDPHGLVDANQLAAYKAFKRNINGELHDVDVLAQVDAGWFMRMQSNFMDLEDTWERILPRDSHGAVTTARWNVLQSRWLEEDLQTVRGATMSGNRPWHEVDLVLIICNVGGQHWVVVTVDLILGKIEIFDPWRQEIPHYIRKQQIRPLRGNCGPHTLRLIEYLLAGRSPFDWSEDDMEIIWEKMVVEIFEHLLELCLGCPHLLQDCVVVLSEEETWRPALRRPAYLMEFGFKITL
ncbi:hypothetical protein Ddye_021019 [Dipteronia dyeriana]|uniref:Ubiquitin-like protease family profile domain-containing protein n=1 Tax=Dipteronia dyeriana TaxID=168575 RepID=A0AAD9WVX6_9ROSI|nr:hypothetical protein Ddye_021019 [Dipteronia dyeriana]